MACYIKITCPQCKDDRIMKAGRNARGEQRYRCQNPNCPTKTFMLSYRYRAYEPGIKDQVVAMAINGSGIRDTGRVLGIDKLERDEVCNLVPNVSKPLTSIKR
jgi:transposase-like protein